MRRTGLLVALAALAAPAYLLAAAPGTRPLPAHQADFFERHVRPVLLANCVECHGPDKQRGGLRLDSRSGLLQGGKRGPAVKPGDPDGSRLIRAIRQAGKLKMPPKGKLSPDAVADLTSWVRGGAPWPSARATPGGEGDGTRHWAFLPVANPAPPPVRDSAWARTSVDSFILARLEAKGLQPSPEADRRTLIRRLTFDLTGLPPAPEEVEAFVNDRRPGAYERLVDRLLASPRYGERWGRYWLDVARFADTKGYVFFEESAFPWAYTYRDYVIEAFNRDLPYDRFVLEQLAADQLPLGKDRRPLRGMGFLTLGGHFMNNPHDIIDDRIDVVSRGLLGLTVTCARCHDHKYDPIPTKDYYSLYGVFASSAEPSLPPLFDDPPATPQYAAFKKELDKRERALSTFIRTKQAEVFSGARTRVAEYLLAAHARRGQPSAEDFMLLTDGGELNPAMLTRWQAYLERTGRKHHRVFSPWHAFAALPEKEFAAKAKELSARLASGSDADGPVNPLVAKAFAERPPKNLADVAARYGQILNATEKMWQEELAKAARAELPPPARLDDPDREELRKVFHGPDAPPDVPPGLIADLDLLPDRPAQDKLQKLRKAVEQWRATGPGAPPRAMVLVDSPRLYEPRVFRRGNPNNPGPAVPRQFLRVLAGPRRKPFTKGSGRLELALAIASKDNPLTARVLVNRVWLHHFGAGLVRTPGDFGTRSDPPSHPELLDHLATYFVQGGWSVKKLHRLIVTSAAYRQASVDRPECRVVDPENLLLWRMNRRRLDFEATRDALLAVSARLDSAVGGPSVKDVVSPSSTRRTLYGFVDRLHVPGLYRTFDFPSPDATSPQRDNTTVPQQALFLMNSPFVLESARGLLRRAGPAKDAEARVGLLYRLCYGRPPGANELALARAFLGGGKGAPGEWERYAQALLLANEFAFVD